MGGSSSIENDAIVQEQQKQATDAQRKENERKARIKLGLQNIGKAFNGTAILAPTTHKFDWKGFNDKTVLPKGWTRVKVDSKGKEIPATPGKAATAATPGGYTPLANAGDPGVGGSAGTVSLIPAHGATAATLATPATTGTTMIKGPDGKLHKIGENFNYTTQDPTGAVTGGFDDAFYNNYGDTYSRYYKGDVQTQYDDATTKQMFALARAGTSASSAANAANVDLIAQKTKNDASIDVKADAAKSALKDKVEAEKQKSIAQLYATEDPDVASNTALAAVRNLSEATPDQTPLAAVFNQATIGAANLLKGYNTGKTYNQFESSLPSGMGSGRNV